MPFRRDVREFPERKQDVQSTGRDLMLQVNDGGQAEDQQACLAIGQRIALAGKFQVVFAPRQRQIAERYRQPSRIARIGEIARSLANSDFGTEIAADAQPVFKRLDGLEAFGVRADWPRPRRPSSARAAPVSARPCSSKCKNGIVPIGTEFGPPGGIGLNIEVVRGPPNLAPAISHIVPERIDAARGNIGIGAAIPGVVEGSDQRGDVAQIGVRKVGRHRRPPPPLKASQDTPGDPAWNTDCRHRCVHRPGKADLRHVAKIGEGVAERVAVHRIAPAIRNHGHGMAAHGPHLGCRLGAARRRIHDG